MVMPYLAGEFHVIGISGRNPRTAENQADGFRKNVVSYIIMRMPGAGFFKILFLIVFHG